MAYQPLYATITDINGTRSSYSCRKKVKWIDIWLNSKIGEVLEIRSSFDEEKNKVILDIDLSDNENVEIRFNKDGLKKIVEKIGKESLDI